MEQEKRSLRTGVTVLLVAIVFRLLSNFLPAIPVSENVASVFLFLETGRVVKYSFPAQEEPPQVQAITFRAEDSQLVSVSNRDKYQVDVAAMLEKPLNWDLTGQEPTVLIVHTHATEAFAETKSGGYRSTDAAQNMLSVGAHLATILQHSGIGVIHDTTLHDKPSYNDAYASSRKSIEAYLAQYPSIRLVLDLHRDSAVDASGKHYAATVSTPAGESAKLMLVMATGAGGQHPAWQENVALGVKLQAVLEMQNPGICRSMLLRTSRYNQDLSPGALLIEVGADGNTQQQAFLATEALANAILTLAYGSSV
jgi:stage II sporulation protein P